MNSLELILGDFEWRFILAVVKRHWDGTNFEEVITWAEDSLNYLNTQGVLGTSVTFIYWSKGGIMKFQEVKIFK